MQQQIEKPLKRVNKSIQSLSPSVLYIKPFIPQKPPKRVIEVKPFYLFTEMRAKEREKFKQFMDSKSKVLKEVKMMEEKRKEEEEKREIKRLRQKTIFRANPVPSFIRENLEKSKQS